MINEESAAITLAAQAERAIATAIELVHKWGERVETLHDLLDYPPVRPNEQWEENLENAITDLLATQSESQRMEGMLRQVRAEIAGYRNILLKAESRSEVIRKRLWERSSPPRDDES